MQIYYSVEAVREIVICSDWKIICNSLGCGVMNEGGEVEDSWGANAVQIFKEIGQLFDFSHFRLS